MADPRLSIIVPVFNTGEHLRTRAFPSLRALPAFEQLHVLLIDDGSTYPETVEAVTELAEAHSNVTAFFHDRGGSGSASRPRNTGFDLADTEYLGFLDPDDVFTGRGPWPLVEALGSHPAAQLAIGNQQRIYTDRTEAVDNTAHYTHYPLGGERYAAGPRGLAAARFRPSNLSSYVLRTSWLKETGIRQVVGAAGQDSLFFRQVFAAAESFIPVPEEIYHYYAETSGSMVNTVTAEYFEKCLIRERAQAQWLSTAGLRQQYVRYGFERAFAWYLPRLRRIPADQRADARRTLHQIAELYVDPAEHRWRYPEVMAFFRRPGIPSAEGLKPLVASARRTARTKGGQAAAAARRIRASARTRRGLDP